MTALYWIIPYILHTALVGTYAWIHYGQFPMGVLPFQVLAYTFYLTISPIFFIYGRFHTSHASREAAFFARKNK